MALLAACGGPRPGPTALSIDEADRAFAAYEPPPAPSGPVTLDGALALADARNPELTRLRLEIDLAGAEVWQASLPPNPTAFAEFEDWAFRESGLGGAKRTVGVSHPIVISGRIGAAVRAAEAGREAAAWTYAAERRRILTEVQVAFVAVLRDRERLRLAREAARLAGEFRDVARAQYEAEAIPEMPVLKAAVALALAEAEATDAEAEARNSETRLRALLAGEAWEDVEFEGTMADGFDVPPLEGLVETVAADHPAVRAAEAGMARADAEVETERARRIPDVSVLVRGGEDVEGSSVVEGGLEVPLPLYDRNQARIAAAEIRAAQARARRAAAGNLVRERLETSHRRLSAAQERARRFREEVLPPAERALEQTRAGYDAGQFTYLDVLDAQRTLAEARAAFVEVLARMNEAAADLESATGRRLGSRP